MRAGFPYRLTARRRAALLTLAVLPALALRALLPVGFMPVMDGAGVHIGFCPGEAQPPGAFAGAPGVTHLAQPQHHGGADHGSPTPASHPPCLFALSASPAFAPPPSAALDLPPAATAVAVDSPTRVFLPAIVRAQTPRGPPFPA